MTRKDFELIAKVLNRAKAFASNDADIAYHQHIVATMADALMTTNPLFNRNKFVEACGHSAKVMEVI